MTLVKAGRLLDPRTGNVLSPAALLIENGRIKEIGSPSRVQADRPAGVQTIDLGGATLLPARAGLVGIRVVAVQGFDPRKTRRCPSPSGTKALGILGFPAPFVLR